MVNVVLPNGTETLLFPLEEVAVAEIAARNSNEEIYCWKTSGRENWLERGLSIVDVLGIVLMPKGLPQVIDMPDDDAEA